MNIDQLKKLNEETVSVEILEIITDAYCNGRGQWVVNAKAGSHFIEFVNISDIERHDRLGLNATFGGYIKIDGVLYDFRINSGDGHGTEILTFELDETSLDSLEPAEKHICHCDYDKVIRVKGCQCGGR